MRAGRSGGSGSAGNRQGHGTDRPDETHRRTSARGRDGRAAVYSHRWSDHRGLRGAGPAGGQRNLENVRRGLFEGLREELKKNHDRHPDIGEPKLHPTAGVTVVGVRKFLIAYNVNLNTSDVSIANKIAKAIRFS